jgi:hypothetical protein
VEVSIGIGIAVIFSVVWPEEEEGLLERMPFSSAPKPGSDDI